MSPSRISGVTLTTSALAAAAFPYLGVLVVLPCTLLAAAGVQVPAAAGALSAEMLWSSGAMIWAQLAGLWRHRQRPDELVIKRLAMLGAIVLVLADSVRGRLAATSYAGLLLDRGRRQGPGKRRSAAQLIGRLLLAVSTLSADYYHCAALFVRECD